MKKWIIGNPDEKAVAAISECGMTKLAAEVLSSRGIKTAEEAWDFLSVDELSDPFVLMGMTEAAGIINGAVDEEKSICIYGDYDCDGITATAMLYMYLECMGANVQTYIPERDEGYGMNADSIRKLANDGVELIITVDNGISAVAEAELIAELDMELVITDHHQPPSVMPKASAIVNPHRVDCPSSFKNLCGAGVVLKLIAALEGGDYDLVFEQYGDLAALGTIADVVDVSGENRFIVKNGLSLLENTEKPGLSALVDACGLSGKKIDSTSAAFMLTPKINASGRFASPSTALRLMLCDDEEEAEELAAQLISYNNERRECEASIINEINNLISDDPSVLSNPVLFFSGEGWFQGVIGIICSRLVERYGKPCFVVTVSEGSARGSARSVEGFSIFKCLESCSSLLTNFGGHLGAGGFSLNASDIGAFKNELFAYCDNFFRPAPVLTVKAEKLLCGADFEVDNVCGLSVLEPFGAGNNPPVFIMAGARVDAVSSVSNGKHTKLKLFYDGISVYPILFGVKPQDFIACNGDKIDLLVSLDENIWNEKRGISVKVRDYRLSGINQQKYFAAKWTYDEYIRGKELPASYYEKIIPTRNELICVYKLLSEKPAGLDSVFARFCRAVPNGNFCKFRIIIDIFVEKSLATFSGTEETVALIPATTKVDILSSEILGKLNGKAN